MTSLSERLINESSEVLSNDTFGGIQFVEVEHEKSDALREYDAYAVSKIKDKYPDVDIVTYDLAREMLPNCFSTDVLQSLSQYAGRKDFPNKITSTGFQMGFKAIHILHILEWNELALPVVSYIPRGDISSIFGKQTKSDIEALPMLHKMIPDGIRDHTDINLPIVNGDIDWKERIYPVYFSLFEADREEISVYSARFRDERIHHIAELPLLRYSTPYTDEMVIVNGLQLYIKKLLAKKDYETAEGIVSMQLSRFVESLALITQVTRYLPNNMDIGAGDWMGILDLYGLDDEQADFPLPKKLKLMTLTGGILEINSYSDWIKQMYSYNYDYKQKKYPLFGIFNETDLKAAWNRATQIQEGKEE